MKSIYQKASDVIIGLIKSNHPNLLSIADFQYRFWFSLQVNDEQLLFPKFDDTVANFPKLIRMVGLDHIVLCLHSLEPDSKGVYRQVNLPILPSFKDCYTALRLAEFPIEMRSLGDVSFVNDVCCP